MKTNIRRRILVITVAAVVILGVVYGFLPKPVPVEVASASRAPMKVTIDEEGKTRVKDRYVLSAPVAGYLRRITLEVGDAVEKGQTIAELEPLRSPVLDPRSRAEAEAAVSAAMAALNAAEENARAASAEAEYAKKKLVRARELYKSEYVSMDFLEQAESDAKRTDANRQAADAAVKVASADLQKARTTLGFSAADGSEAKGRIVSIRTPVKGRVLKLHRESEGTVNQGEPLLDIGNPANIEVKAEVLSADAVTIKPGTPVLFERWGGDEPLSGKVRVVEPAAFTKISSLGVEEQRVLVIADITSLPESWARLGDGYRVEASFILWEGRDVLQVPENALFRRADGWAVFVVENRRARLRKVEVGNRNGLSAEIISGISGGDVVIQYPDDSIDNNTRVRIR